jgi:hypothetical protein
MVGTSKLSRRTVTIFFLTIAAVGLASGCSRTPRAGGGPMSDPMVNGATACLVWLMDEVSTLPLSEAEANRLRMDAPEQDFEGRPVPMPDGGRLVKAIDLLAGSPSETNDVPLSDLIADACNDAYGVG